MLPEIAPALAEMIGSTNRLDKRRMVVSTYLLQLIDSKGLIWEVTQLLGVT